MPHAEVSPELLDEMFGLIDEWNQNGGCTEDLCVDLVRAVRRDFALAGVQARGLTSDEARIMGAKGAALAGRPRRGETREEARMRKLGLSTGEIQAVTAGDIEAARARSGRGS